VRIIILKYIKESKTVQEEVDKEGLKKVLIIDVGKKNIYTVDLT